MGPKNRDRFILRWSVLQMIRFPIPSLLRLLLCAVIVIIIGQFCLTESLYREMREKLVITGYFNQCINARELRSLQGGIAGEIYYEHEVLVNVGRSNNGINFDVILTNNPVLYLSGDTDIQIADGYELTDLTQLGNNYLLVGDTFLTMTMSAIGDTIEIYPAGTLDRILLAMEEKYDKEHGGKRRSEDEIYLLYLDEIEELMRFYQVEATIIGCFHTKSQAVNSLAITPGLGEITGANTSFLGPNVILDRAKVLTDYSKAQRLREYGEHLSDGRRQAFTMDTAGLEELTGSIETMKTYYPWLLLIMLLILLAILFFSNNQKMYSVSILRCLGVPRYRVLGSIACENMMIIVIGIIVGGVGLYIWNKNLHQIVITRILFVGVMELVAGVVATGMSSILISKHSPLALLQTKE